MFFGALCFSFSFSVFVRFRDFILEDIHVEIVHMFMKFL